MQKQFLENIFILQSSLAGNGTQEEQNQYDLFHAMLKVQMSISLLLLKTMIILLPLQWSLSSSNVTSIKLNEQLSEGIILALMLQATLIFAKA
jgi:hypothetical protein